MRLIVEREEERRAFRSAAYWDLEARLQGEGREFVATLVRLGDERDRNRQGLRRRRPVRSRTRTCACSTKRSPTALVEAVRSNVPWQVTSVEAEARRRASGAAVHDLHAHAGSQPQARVLHRTDDADRAAPVSGRGHRQGRDGPHHLSPHRLDDAVGQGAERVGARDPGDVRRRVLRRAAALPDPGEERAGSARGDSSDRRSVWRRASSNACSTPTTSRSTS